MSMLGALINCGCKGEAQLRAEKCDTLQAWYLSCSHCGIRTAGQPTPELAAYAWNRAFRTPDGLKPCICGCVAALYYDSDGGYHVACAACGAASAHCESPVSAIKTWNNT